ncbi:uncharacterized protein KNAG_0K00940 [Huiozyma naganishii CBS 8797]|uniref:Uncharacterized protein n=1 Tax=Huiozyma naganishii (strain ATCC MYA-139 / BCRC 22969 / CBS 8797 / KCTC 17520 / NBRC 10181 / NCYC 3082 / Yp74L-3) TaxID=1071383 RepID=J7SA62_HUIN7|nr:hypothetical protein KNAG_0K00940 [Kazachstania naganishii CBS 8797]CCK72459.1 hypothetical protein KNAG_0K00940 [Kazachstania naganishii CBS 8797]
MVESNSEKENMDVDAKEFLTEDNLESKESGKSRRSKFGFGWLKRSHGSSKSKKVKSKEIENIQYQQKEDDCNNSSQSISGQEDTSTDLEKSQFTSTNPANIWEEKTMKGRQVLAGSVESSFDGIGDSSSKYSSSHSSDSGINYTGFSVTNNTRHSIDLLNLEMDNTEYDGAQAKKSSGAGTIKGGNPADLLPSKKYVESIPVERVKEKAESINLQLDWDGTSDILEAVFFCFRKLIEDKDDANRLLSEDNKQLAQQLEENNKRSTSDLEESQKIISKLQNDLKELELSIESENKMFYTVVQEVEMKSAQELSRHKESIEQKAIEKIKLLQDENKNIKGQLELHTKWRAGSLDFITSFCDVFRDCASPETISRYKHFLETIDENWPQSTDSVLDETQQKLMNQIIPEFLSDILCDRFFIEVGTSFNNCLETNQNLLISNRSLKRKLLNGKRIVKETEELMFKDYSVF